MTTLVRRHHPRITLPIVAYMEIEPGNGAIVLNVSREGLCFQAVSPLEPGAPVLFSFKERNRHMAGCGELVWLDDRKKCGGVRFTTLSREAREQVDQWIASAPPEDGVHDIPDAPDSRPGEGGARDEEQDKRSNAQVAALRLARRAPAPLKVSIKGGRRSTVLSVMLCGSIILASVMLFGYAHRRDLGETLVHLGERLGARPGRNSAALESTTPLAPPSQVPAPVEPAALPGDTASTSDKASDPQTPPEAEVTIKHFTDSDAQQAKSSNPESSPPQGNVPSTPIPPADAPDAQQFALAASPAFMRTPSTVPKLAFNQVPTQAVVAEVTSAPNDATIHMYLDIGRFRGELAARDVRDKVASLGLRATVLKSRSIWKTSYQVLVGPYGDQDEQTTVEADLVSHGYKPRPFERGSRGFVFRSRLDLNGAQLPVGDSYTISWESYVENANVRFAHGDEVIATARGRWVERHEKYSQDEYVYVRNGASKTLIEIHFAGLKRALVFDGSS